MDPNLPILKGVNKVLDVVLIGQSTAIELETTRDFLSLLRCQKVGSLRIVVHDQVGDKSGDESDDTFEDEDPTPAGASTEAVHLNDTAS